MKKNLKISLAVLIIASAVVLQSCQKDSQLEPQLKADNQLQKEYKYEKVSTFYGPTIPIGQGVARAWVKENENGDPVAVGLNLTEKALQGLPGPGQTPEQYVFFFPKTKGKNFYTHMLVDWNPDGHEPPGIYTLPHFDFHFYFIPNEERLQIPFLSPPAFDLAPAPEYFPDGYMFTPGLVPEMGAHSVDVWSPEFAPGGVFTKTYIWGSYQGEFIFFEPMITRSYLLTHPEDMILLRQPSAYQRDGWYPEYYSIKYSSNPNHYTIALENLKFVEGE